MTKPKTPRKQINLKAVIILTAATVALGGLLYVAHAVQVQRTAVGLREQADLFKEQGKGDLAVKALFQYLGMAPDDNDARTKFGFWQAELAKTPPEKLYALLVLKQAARHDQELE